MANNLQSFTLQINGVTQTINNVGDLNNAVQTLNNQLNAAQFGTPQFQALQQQLNRANQAVGQVQTSIQGLSNEQKLETIGKLGESIAGGFALATGAAGAFGKSLGLSAEKVAEYEQSAQSVVLMLQGYKSLMEGLTGQNLANIKTLVSMRIATLQTAAANTQASIAAKLFGTTTRAAMTATGIGILLVALGLVISNFDSIKAAALGFASKFQPVLDSVTKKFNELKDAARNVLNVVTFGLVDNAKTATAKAVAEEVKAKAKGNLEKLKADEDFNKRSIALLNVSETEKLRLLLIYEKKKLDAVKATFAKNTAEYKDQHLKVLEAEKVFQEALVKAGEDAAAKAKERAEKAKEARENAKEKADKAKQEAEQKKKEEYEKGIWLDEYLAKQKFIDSLPKPKFIEIPKPTEEDVDRFKESMSILFEGGFAPDDNLLDTLFGTGAEEKFVNVFNDLAAIEDAILTPLREAKLAEFDAQIAGFTAVIDDASARISDLNSELEESTSKVDDLESQLLTAKGTARQNLINQLEKERKVQAQLNADKVKEDARIKKAEADKLAAEKKKSAELEKQNKLKAVATMVTQGLAAVEAVLAGITAAKAIASAASNGKVGWDNIAIAIGATAALVGAFVAMKSAAKGFEEGGFTGSDVSDKKAVGVVHANEWVAPASMVRKNPDFFNSLDAQRRSGNFSVSTPADTTNLMILQTLVDIQTSNLSVANRPVQVAVQDIATKSDRVNNIKQVALK